MVHACEVMWQRRDVLVRYVPCSNGGTYWYVPPLPRDLADLTAQIIAAGTNIDTPMLTRVRQELEYRIGVCRVTRGAHIEHL
jgi:hypothetical protein